MRLSPTQVQVFHRGAQVAHHPRCLGRHQVFTDPEHQQKPWKVRQQSWPLASTLAPGLELPPRASVNVQVRDLSVYEALLGEVEP